MTGIHILDTSRLVTGLTNHMKIKRILMAVLPFFHFSLQAGGLSDNQFDLDLTSFSRDSDSSVTYVYDNSGTVNNRVDDLPLGSTSSFDDDADTGYRISASWRLTGKWALNGAIMASEMSASDSFSDSGAQLEVFRSPHTQEFDAANSVRASYLSEFSGEELNAVYRYSETIDFFLGLGHLSLEERFRMISDDTALVGSGSYVIRTDNDMLGPHVGVALDHMYGDKFGVYLIGKIGWYDNDADQRQRVDDPVLARSNRGSASQTSSVSDIQIGLSYYFTEEFALNFGYQAIEISDVALAEDQFDTTQAGSNDVDDGGDIDCDGFNLGLKVSF
jgi:hypothetical protein